MSQRSISQTNIASHSAIDYSTHSPISDAQSQSNGRTLAEPDEISPQDIHQTSSEGLTDETEKQLSAINGYGTPAAEHQSNLKASVLKHSLRTWWLEFLTCGLVLIALVAMTITLILHQDRPLPDWPYRLSINSLISIYVVVLKSGVLLIIAEGMENFLLRDKGFTN